MNLLRSIEITAELFSINATKYRPDMSHRKTVTKQVVAKALKETLDTQNYLRKSKDTSLILPFIGQKQSFLPRSFQNGPPHISYCSHKFELQRQRRTRNIELPCGTYPYVVYKESRLPLWHISYPQWKLLCGTYFHFYYDPSTRNK